MQNTDALDIWKQFPCKQLDFYPFDSLDARHVVNALKALPGIVSVDEIRSFRNRMQALINENTFIFQGGYCAEGFSESNLAYIENQLHLIENVSKIYEQVLKRPVIKLARIAGQYGKPRTEKYDKTAANKILNYYGDIINSAEQHALEREPTPFNMLIAYANSKKMYNHIKTLQKSRNVAPYDQTYISHEAFLLPYEDALTRSIDDEWYNLSAHFLWIGYRSIYPNSPHVEYASRIANPVGIKVGPALSAEFLTEIVRKLNPENKSNKITIIYRLGSKLIGDLLPKYIKEMAKSKMKVTWVCDPMHGNTSTINNRKVRFVNDIMVELRQALDIHRKLAVKLSGIHLECSAQKIYECPQDELEVENLKQSNYESLMDPRLNHDQVQSLISNYLRWLADN